MTIARPAVQLAVVLGACLAPSIARAEDEKMTLAQAYQLATRYSDSVLLAERTTRAAEIQLAGSWSEVRPTLTATAQAALQRETAVDTPMGVEVLVPGQIMQVALVAQQPLFRRGFFSSRDAGRHGVEAAGAALARERELLARDVTNAFIDVLRTRALVTASEGAVKRTKAQYDHAVGRVKAGNALKSAELLAQIDANRAELQLVTTKRDVGVAEATFRRIVGKSPPAILELPQLPDPPAPAEGLNVAKRRADVQALGFRIEEARARIESARGRRWWPRLDLQGSVSYFQPENLGSNVDWQVLGILTIPLLENGQQAMEISLRENDARIAALQLDRQQKLLSEEIDAAAVVVAMSRETFTLAEKQHQTARDHYTLVDKQFRLGAITFLEVANATAALSQAENIVEVARMDRVRAVYDYLFVIGALDLGGSAKP